MTRRTLGIAAAAVIAVGLVWGVAGATPVLAQDRGKAETKTPANFAYEIVNGRRVPRGNRVTNADGSWREEVRDGACVTLKEKTAAGEYRETRKCD